MIVLDLLVVAFFVGIAALWVKCQTLSEEQQARKREDERNRQLGRDQ